MVNRGGEGVGEGVGVYSGLERVPSSVASPGWGIFRHGFPLRAGAVEKEVWRVFWRGGCDGCHGGKGESADTRAKASPGDLRDGGKGDLGRIPGFRRAEGMTDLVRWWRADRMCGGC